MSGKDLEHIPSSSQVESGSLHSRITEEECAVLSSVGKSIHFETLVRFLNRFVALKGVKKVIYAKDFIKLLFKNNRSSDFTYSILRLLLPGDDRERGNYGLKEKTIAKVATESLGLGKDNYERLKHYKNPSFQHTGVGIGDFSLCFEDVVKPYLKAQSSLTVQQLNKLLDELSSNSQQHVPVFTKLFNCSNAEELKWVVRIILKDLKVSLRIQTILSTFHRDAHDYFNLTNSLLETCRKFEDSNVSLDDEVKLFCPIRPMLAGKKKITFFKEGKLYYVETKFDGERVQAHKSGEKVQLYSRNSVNYTSMYQQIAQLVADHVPIESCILDGEVIVLERNSLKMIQFGLNKVVALNKQSDEFQLCYKIFDVLWVKDDGHETNLMKLPLKNRRKVLQRIVRERSGKIEVVLHEQIAQYNAILTRFSSSIDNNEEGIMLKDPDSIYVPKERGCSWLKLKGDYVQGLTDTLDLIIMGGYYGDTATRHGEGRHWTDQITSFLVGVITRIDQLNPKIAYALPFAKVGTGYSMEELSSLRSRLQTHLSRNEGRHQPSYLEYPWKHSLQDRPDCWVDHLYNSMVLEVKAAEIIASDSYPTGHTLRFPRVAKIRYDKDWNQATSKSELDDLLNNVLYTKNMRRRDDSDEQENKNEGKRTMKDDPQPKKKHKVGDILEEFQSFNMESEGLVSHLFSGLQFSVLSLHWHSKHKIERQIQINGGQVVQNPLASTSFIVADQIDFRLRAYQLQAGREFTFVRPNYILNCITAEALLPLSPLYLTVLPLKNLSFYRENFDRFHDSYTASLGICELEEILANMNDSYPINETLVAKIALRQPRQGQVTYCIGVSELIRAKLVLAGDVIVDSLELFPNTIIVGRELTGQEQNELENYQRREPTLVTSLKELIDAGVL